MKTSPEASSGEGQRPSEGGTLRLFASGKGSQIAVYGLMALAVAAVMAILVSLSYGGASSVAGFATLLPVGYAFAAGMVASVNPCGFFMLPAYVAYQLGTEEQGFYQSSALVRLYRAILVALVATAGFMVTFAIIGYIIALGGRWLVALFPYASLVIGVGLASLGVWLLATHKPLGITAASRVGVAPQRSLRNIFLFGMGYGICSLSCTLPIFLVVVGSSLATKGFGASFGQFISYALGMGTILIAITVGAALFKGAVARSLKKALPYIHTLGALFLVGAGIYIVFYWVRYGGIF